MPYQMRGVIQFQTKKPMREYSAKKQEKIVDGIMELILPDVNVIGDIEVHTGGGTVAFLAVLLDGSSVDDVSSYGLLKHAPTAVEILQNTVGMYADVEIKGKLPKHVQRVIDYLPIVDEDAFSAFIKKAQADGTINLQEFLQGHLLPVVDIREAAKSLMSVLGEVPLVEDDKLTAKGEAFHTMMHKLDDPLKLMKDTISKGLVSEEDFMYMLQFTAGGGCALAKSVLAAYTTEKQMNALDGLTDSQRAAIALHMFSSDAVN